MGDDPSLLLDANLDRIKDIAERSLEILASTSNEIRLTDEEKRLCVHGLLLLKLTLNHLR